MECKKPSELPKEKTEKKEKVTFYCYICKKNFTKKLSPKKNPEINCTKCQKNFIEKLKPDENFTPIKIPNYKLDKKSKFTLREEHPNHRIIEKTVRMSNSSPYVQDVLMEIFPQVFQRASINRIRTIRNILNTLNILEVDNQSDSGPTDEIYIKNLVKVFFRDFDSEKKEKFKNCPICTENFEGQDLIVSLECQHFFHEYCILPWLNLNNSCPNCRFTLPRKNSL